MVPHLRLVAGQYAPVILAETRLRVQPLFLALGIVHGLRY